MRGRPFPTCMCTCWEETNSAGLPEPPSDCISINHNHSLSDHVEFDGLFGCFSYSFSCQHQVQRTYSSELTLNFCLRLFCPISANFLMLACPVWISQYSQTQRQRRVEYYLYSFQKLSLRMRSSWEKLRSSSCCTNQSVISRSKKPACRFYIRIMKFDNCQLVSMLEEWGLILSVTTVSITMLMIIGAFFAVLPQAMQYYQQSRTMILLLSNCFNIFYIIISPLIFNILSKYYVKGVLISTIATGVAAVGRYLAGQNYTVCLAMTIIVAISHIPIITAPYGLLKLFPDYQRAYAASIPLFLPVLGINFCILYGMAFIAGDGNPHSSLLATHQQISKLNGIIAVVGIVSAILTILLLLRLRSKIQTEEEVANHENQVEVKNLDQEASSTAVDQPRETFTQNLNHLKATLKIFSSQKRTTIILIAWGSIVGVNWTYGSLFGIIFTNQGLSEKQIALIGLAANLSSAFLSNLGSYIKNHSTFDNNKIIQFLNGLGLAAAVIIQLSRLFPVLQNLTFLVVVIIVLRAGFSSFVSLAFVEMEKEKMSSLVISGFFFWIANVVNLLGMELVDIAPTDLSLMVMSAIVAYCIYYVKKINQAECFRI